MRGLSPALSYRYVLESSCGERGFLGRYRVVVRDGSGLPRSLEIDHLPGAINDEECYRVSTLRVLD